jgi:capsular polysaccharide biosynthesis protein/Mrp family chromosome partitioning ATPase
MELRILLGSVKRWWVPILLAAFACSQLGLIVALAANATSTAEASLIIQPPASTLGGNINYADPDRYVDTQLVVLKSPQITQLVMESLGMTGPTDPVSKRIRVTHAPKSDLVKVFATGKTDDEAIELANAYVKNFIADQEARLGAARGPELDLITQRLETIGESLRAAEDRVYNDPSDSSARVDRDALLVEYTELVRSKTAYEFTNRARVNSSVAEFAASAERSGVRPPLRWTALGLIVGLLLASAIAVGWSWLTPTVVDENQLGELVGAPVGPSLPWLRPQVPSRNWFLQPTSTSYSATVKDICIRADNAVPLAESFKIAVVGVHRGLGTSGLAVAIGSFFSRSANVLLVDGNPEDSDLSVAFDAFDGERISTFDLTQVDSTDTALRRFIKRLPDSSIDFIGGLAPRLNRFNVAPIMERFESVSDVVVVDCAPFNESALTISVCEVADVVVLVVPPRKLMQETIRQFMAQVGDTPVVAVVSTGRRSGKKQTQRTTDPRSGAGSSSLGTGTTTKEARVDELVTTFDASPTRNKRKGGSLAPDAQ